MCEAVATVKKQDHLGGGDGGEEARGSMRVRYQPLQLCFLDSQGVRGPIGN